VGAFGRLNSVRTIHARLLIERILTHLGLMARTPLIDEFEVYCGVAVGCADAAHPINS
jgi:hypothetical protein